MVYLSKQQPPKCIYLNLISPSSTPNSWILVIQPNSIKTSESTPFTLHHPPNSTGCCQLLLDSTFTASFPSIPLSIHTVHASSSFISSYSSILPVISSLDYKSTDFLNPLQENLVKKTSSLLMNLTSSKWSTRIYLLIEKLWKTQGHLHTIIRNQQKFLYGNISHSYQNNLVLPWHSPAQKHWLFLLLTIKNTNS